MKVLCKLSNGYIINYKMYKHINLHVYNYNSLTKTLLPLPMKSLYTHV